ncbi:MAG: zinc metallopeptidase [Clostridia bacterium]|nr:zinc metallopeptidase [Clostridia bacterium]
MPGGYYYGIDWTYLVYVLPALIFSLWASYNVKSTFAKYTRVASDRGMTGYDAARLILDANGLSHVQIGRIAGDMTDHFDPKDNIIRLSDTVYDVRSAAAVGVAAHEAGHAVQYAVGYSPMKLRASIIPLTNLGATISWPLVLLGVMLSFETLATIGVFLFGAVVVFQLVTLPVEFNASRRAVEALQSSGMSAEGLDAAKKVLTAAAMTYVAALATALGNFLRLLSIANRSRRD